MRRALNDDECAEVYGCSNTGGQPIADAPPSHQLPQQSFAAALPCFPWRQFDRRRWTNMDAPGRHSILSPGTGLPGIFVASDLSKSELVGLRTSTTWAVQER